MYQIIDEGLFCTIAFIRDGIAQQIPTGFCRVGDEIFIHASAKSGFMDAIIEQEVSFSVTHMDGLVLSPTAFDSSFNYRSVIGFSKAEEITDPSEKHKFFILFTERYAPGRVADVGQPTADQVSITKIVRLSLKNAGSKIRTGDVNMKLSEKDAWCGVVPVKTTYGTPQKDGQLPESLQLPIYIKELVDGSGST
jgi:nitroimidazol reductase NimA-like FMN-containing flavoprotein (pyridoxamine 5'-phosphate oxidase superfamily)